MHHTFVPDKYYNAFGSYPPVLTIQSGDVISTTTLDAWGCDCHSTKVAERGNPLTGPFAVAGAEVGDVLRCTLEVVEPDRSWGFSRNVVAPHVVDPEYVKHLPESGVVNWEVDCQRKTACPDRAVSKLGEIELAPMLGCLGTAPPSGQAIASATSGPYGGNMDYRGFVAGATVYLPIFVPGALFFLGDGHAVQGDGEIGGTGIEISMNVRFRLELCKGAVQWPRAETGTHIFTVGNARPLEQALQHATTEMLRWLQNDYGYSTTDASLLLAQCGQYHVGNVFDPAYTMVCLVEKRRLFQTEPGA